MKFQWCSTVYSFIYPFHNTRRKFLSVCNLAIMNNNHLMTRNVLNIDMYLLLIPLGDISLHVAAAHQLRVTELISCLSQINPKCNHCYIWGEMYVDLMKGHWDSNVQIFNMCYTLWNSVPIQSLDVLTTSKTLHVLLASHVPYFGPY